MAKDIFTRLDRCSYCGRPGVISWDVDLFSCTHEVCEALAYGEVQRRAHAGHGRVGRKLEGALLRASATPSSSRRPRRSMSSRRHRVR